MKSDQNYLALFFVIAAAVAVGNIASHAAQSVFWMIAWQESVDQFRAELDRRLGDSDQIIEDANRRTNAQVRAAAQEQRRQRQQSPTAKRLASHCKLWRKNHVMTPTDTTARASEYYCRGYERFIETGKAPKGDAPLLETR